MPRPETKNKFLCVRYGFPAIKRAIVAAQYHDSKGTQFGGKKPKVTKIFGFEI